METVEQKVASFHRATGIEQLAITKENIVQVVELLGLRYKLVEEERQELKDAYMELMNSCLLKIQNNEDIPVDIDQVSRHFVDFADALVDIVYVAVGALDVFGLSFDELFDEVHRNNLTKLDEHGKARIADGETDTDSSGNVLPKGKVMKPVGYKPVDLQPLVRRSLAEMVKMHNIINEPVLTNNMPEESDVKERLAQALIDYVTENANDIIERASQKS